MFVQIHADPCEVVFDADLVGAGNRPVLLALLLAYLLNPLIVWCERKWRWSRLSSVVALCAVASAAVLGLAAAVLPIAVAQAQQLVGDLPEYADTLSKRQGITDETVLKGLREKVAEFARNPAGNVGHLWDGVVTAIGLMGGVVGMATSKAIGIALFPVSTRNAGHGLLGH